MAFAPSWPVRGTHARPTAVMKSAGALFAGQDDRPAQPGNYVRCRRNSRPPAVHRLRERAGALDRPFVPGPLLVGRVGRGAPDAGSAVAQLALNPVRARLVQRPHDWAWSSLRAHLAGRDDGLVTVEPMLERLGRITALVDSEPEETALTRLRTSEATGRPLGSDEFVTQLECLMQRRLRRQKPGRKANAVECPSDLFSRRTTNGRSIG
jgi:hypothetical protein